MSDITDKFTNEQAIQESFRHYQAGNLQQAEVVCRKVIDVEPGHPEALHLLGMISHNKGNSELAIELINKAIRFDPSNPFYYNNLGEVYRSKERYEQAMACYQEAVLLEPEFSGAHNNLGIALRNLGKPEQALLSYQKAVRINPDYAEAHNNIANLFREMGEYEQAVASYQKVTTLKPDHFIAHYCLGDLFSTQGKHESAITSLRKAISLKPDFYDAHFKLGNLLSESGKLDQAIVCYQRAISLNPDSAEAYSNMGSAYKESGKHQQALDCFLKAISLNPDYEKAYYNAGIAYKEQGQHKQALDSFQKAVLLNPDFLKARWAYAVEQVPVIYGLNDDPEECREALFREFSNLSDWFAINETEQSYQAVGSHQPFFLAYQEENNRNLLSQYGTLCAGLMGSWQARRGYNMSGSNAGEVIRVGIVSAQILDHSVWNALVKGWFQYLDRGRFELYVFHVGAKQDKETVWAKSKAAFFAQGSKELEQWVELIRDKQPDVLMYPEIGMDQMTVRLASMRLAAVQVAAWGHPETTGLPTIDYYLSVEDFEPASAQENYTEQLVQLPHLGCCYQPLAVKISEPDLSQLGINREFPVLLCPGAPFKYAPRHDAIFVEIARRAGRCQFVFFIHHHHGLSEKLRMRLEAVFDKAGLEFGAYAIFIPWQERSLYYGLMKRADVFMDTIGFSGFNTAMQAVECDLPVVTMDGRFMRGRLGSGILKRMGLTELIAHSEEEYIELVVKLASDAEYRQSIRSQIKDVRFALFDDIAPIRAMEKFLSSVTKTD